MSEEKETKKERFLETIKEKGIGYKMPNGQLLEVSMVDPAILEMLIYLIESVEKIKKNVA